MILDGNCDLSEARLINSLCRAFLCIEDERIGDWDRTDIGEPALTES